MTLTTEPAATHAATPTPTRTTTADPLALALLLVAVGAVNLGLQLTGFVDTASIGSPLAVLLAAGGLGIGFAAAQAHRLGDLPVSSLWNLGTTLPATVLGLLSAFFLSYGLLVLGLVHGWLPIVPEAAADTQQAFQIGWLVVFALATITALRLPIIAALTGSFSVALLLLVIATGNESEGTQKLAGWVVLAIALAASYVYVSVATAANGGRELPVGPVPTR